MAAETADVAVVGSGFTGLLVARELIAAGREVLVLERGVHKPHARQLEDGDHEARLPTTEHNEEPAPGQEPYPWAYVYGVGGGSLRWTGVAPRLLPSDFRLRSDHGVGRDWPIGYEDLAGHYEVAERLLAVAGGDNPHFPRSAPPPQPPHQPSPVDRLVAEPLAPFYALPQARPSLPVNARPACCGNTNCALCPVDARTSMLHLLDDEELLADPRLDVRQGIAVARLRSAAGRVAALECVDAGRRRLDIRARTVVLAAGGLENPAILLRSGLDGEHVGRRLFDHGHKVVHVELDRPSGSGAGAAHITGVSYAWADGDWRGDHGSQLVMPINQGLLGSRPVLEGIVAGVPGPDLHAELRRRMERTLVFDVVGEDLASEARFVELSPARDRLGLPRSRVHYGPDTAYLTSARRRMLADLERRLAPLGGRVVAVERAGEGAHQLGTCFMGDGGVVDAQLRHHSLANLYVAGGSAFPSYSAHHPTLTICALALRLGRHLAGEI